MTYLPRLYTFIPILADAEALYYTRRKKIKTKMCKKYFYLK